MCGLCFEHYSGLILSRISLAGTRYTMHVHTAWFDAAFLASLIYSPLPQSAVTKLTFTARDANGKIE